MPSALRRAVRQALANPALRAALDANAQRRRAARQRTLATLPRPWPEMQAQARAVRQRTLAHWDALLDQFVARVQAHGTVVHRAADAAEARAIVDFLLRKHRARLVVKSKSMLSEEIGLNPALEAAGIQVLETDLGEFIVQLRGEPPAHIITPAVHLRRAEVARTFHDKLGVPYTEDVARLTAFARQHLRRAFLKADVGISGVNFGVAETGTLVLVTNEGNGRMVTTLPRVHIALMGRERLVATMDDLALMLNLLPRSATGQRLTAYVSLLHGPRAAPDRDGPLERHLIIVDNGRAALAQTGLADILTCIRCGACLNACPAFQEIGGHAYVGAHGEPTPYPGPMGLVVSAGLFGGETFGPTAQLCTLCGVCGEVCPVGIPLPELILRVRAGEPQPDPRGAPPRPRGASPSVQVLLRLYTALARRPGAFRAAAAVLRPLVRVVGRWAFVPWVQGAAVPPPALPPGGLGEPAPPRPRPAATDAAATRPPQPPPDLLARFVAAARAVDAEVQVLPVAQAADQVVVWLRQHAAQRVLWGLHAAWAEPIRRALLAAGFHLHTQPHPQAQAGLTTALLGIAETGSVLLADGPEHPLTASLLPPAHGVLLPASALVPTLAAALQHPAWQQAPAAVLITGPSRTADIEMTLTVGVHGPGVLQLWLLEDV